MKRFLQVACGLIGAYFTLLVVMPSIAVGAATPSKSDNRNKQDYLRMASTVTSYLYDNGNGRYTRVEHVTKKNVGKVAVEIYDSSFKLLSQKYISDELPLFGGFYSGKNYNYIIYGQSNYEQSKKKEVMRIVRYSKDWKRLNDCRYYDINTVAPFQSGSLRAVEGKGYLYIRTCHRMYKSKDGYYHQSNMTFQIQVSDAKKMKMTDSQHGVGNIGNGFVSHSFNQFITIDSKGNLLTYDHGDAYPRSNVLMKYTPNKAHKALRKYTVKNVNILKYTGAKGENDTGGSIGGLQTSSTTYLTVGNYDGGNKNGARNVYLSITKANQFNQLGTKVIWLTSYKKSSKTGATTPQMVKFSDNVFLVMWGIKKQGNDTNKTEQSQLCYVFVDRNGRQLSKVKTVNGYLSDCQPIVSNGKTIWYATNGQSIIFQTISKDGTYQSMKKCFAHTWNKGKVIKRATCTKNGKITYTCTKCGATLKNIPIYRPKKISLSKTGKVISVKDCAGKIIKPSNYTVTYGKGAKNIGKHTVTIKFKGRYSGTMKKEFVISPKPASILSITPRTKAFTLKWKSQGMGCQIQYSTNSRFSKAKKITIANPNKSSYTIRKLSGKKKYYVRIRTYKVVSKKKYFSSWSKIKTVTTKK